MHSCRWQKSCRNTSHSETWFMLIPIESASVVDCTSKRENCFPSTIRAVVLDRGSCRPVKTSRQKSFSSNSLSSCRKIFRPFVTHRKCGGCACLQGFLQPFYTLKDSWDFKVELTEKTPEDGRNTRS